MEVNADAAPTDITFPFLKLPPEIQRLIVQLACSRAKKTLFSACHTTRRLVLASIDLASINLEPGAGTCLSRAAQLLESPSPLALLRIGRRTGHAPSFLPSLLDALTVCNGRALQLWNHDISNENAVGAACSCASLHSLAIDLSCIGSTGSAAFVHELSSVCAHLTRLELNFGTASECLAPLAVPTVLPDLQQLVVNYVNADICTLSSPHLLLRITELSVNLEPCAEEAFAIISSPWVVKLLAVPQAFEHLRSLSLSGMLPWSCMETLVVELPALTMLQAVRLLPPRDGMDIQLPTPLRLRVLQLVELDCSHVPRLASLLKQVSTVNVQTLLLPEIVLGKEEQAVRELQQASAVLGSVPCMGGIANEMLSTYSRCIDLEPFTAWLCWKKPTSCWMAPALQGAEPVEVMLPMAHHLGAVSLASNGVPPLAASRYGMLSRADLGSMLSSQWHLGVLLGPHTHTLNIGRSIAMAQDLWALVEALPLLKVLCFSLRNEMEAPLQGLIEACEAAHRRLKLQAVGYERPVIQEAAVARLSASCRDWVDVELYPI